MKRITFGKYAGVRIKGTVSMENPRSSLHLDRASWLTAQVESGGKFGCVINYDGTGMTAGIHQAILVYPRALDDGKKSNDQGPLWSLLARIGSLSDLPDSWWLLQDNFCSVGWALSKDGKCRSIKTGKLISGQSIRKEVNGAANGCMPSIGAPKVRVEKWAKLFHELFVDGETYGVQLDFGERHFIKRSDKVKLHRCKNKNYKSLTIQEACYGDTHMSVATMEDLGEMDLAMSVFWSHTVNAPAITLRKLCKLVDRLGPCNNENRSKFARGILKELANSNYGRWNDNIKNGRWQRTRRAAKQVWSSDLFDANCGIMPKKVLG